MKEEILYLQNHEIDKLKWDQLVQESPNGLIYASSIYLDHMCENWDAIVINDYEAVMPIPRKKKYGIQYVYQPPFVQQLGLVYKNERFKSFLQPALQKIIGQIKFGDYPLNFNNFSSIAKQNFILSLHNNYKQISEGYSNDLKRNIKNAEKHHLIYNSTTDYENAINQYKMQYSSRIPHITLFHYQKLKELIKLLIQQNKLIIREAKDESGNLVAVNVCLKDSKRIYLLLSSTTDIGRKKEANHFLLDQTIREFAGQNLIFDFEGSDIPGIAYFYQGFGATNQLYYFYNWNNLPLMIKMMKKFIDKISK